MFELLFKYPASVFSKGTFVFLAGWPTWMLAGGIVAGAAIIGWLVWLRHKDPAPGVRGFRRPVLWVLESALLAILLLMIWHPALSVATLKPQQNIIAVVVDDSSSMALKESTATRKDHAVEVLNGGLLESLRKRFQVRLYRLGDNLARIEKLDQLSASERSTRIGEGMKQVVADAASLPIGAVVLLSDGADNSGGIDLETISEVRRQRIPVHTVGFGREQFAKDVEVRDMQIPQRAIADSRLSASVTLRQRGYAGSKARVTLREGGKTLATRDITFKSDGVEQTEQLLFNAGNAGAKTVEVSVEQLNGEENSNNNKMTRLVNVDSRRPRILYLEGEPRWDYKFIRRAVEDDRNLEVVTILRTTQNKIYRQGIDAKNPKELETGFPTKVEELFGFDGIIVGAVDAPYLTVGQQELLKQFVDRRGGGVLFLGGRTSLSDGGWAKTVVHEVMPVTLPDRKTTFKREGAKAEPTVAGRESLICRLEEDYQKNVDRWKSMPHMLSFQDPGQPKPGALVLMESIPCVVAPDGVNCAPQSSGRVPLLVTQNYGRGRTAVFASGGSWTWQMQNKLEDKTHEIFWSQLLRWLVKDTPSKVVASTPRQVLADESGVRLRAEVRDRTYLPAPDAKVEAHILGPEGLADNVEMRPDPVEPGVYTADYTAPKAGSYLVEMVAKRNQDDSGRDVITFRREDGVAENFRAEQNRELLEKLSSETGGRYYRPQEASKLANEINYSEAGITVREMKDLWDMPIAFLLLALLRAGDWVLRRKWGII